MILKISIIIGIISSVLLLMQAVYYKGKIDGLRRATYILKDQFRKGR